MCEVMECVHPLLPELPSWPAEAQLLDLADLSLGPDIVKFFDRKQLTHVAVHAAEVVAGDVVKVAVDARQMRAGRTAEDLQGCFCGAIVVKIKGDESYWGVPGLAQPLRDGGMYIS